MFVGVEQQLYDKKFLKQIDEYPQREVYAKIISLTWEETPIAEISGCVTGGSITVDGSSSTRRTCSLNVLTQEDNAILNKINWGLNTKFAILIGLKNFVDETQSDIIWFQEGIFILTSYSQTRNQSGNTISIQGKDKMCLLDGTVGGELFADHDFGKIEIIDTYTADAIASSHYDYVTIYDIVKNLVHTYALEPYENIIITDLDDIAVELLDYKLTEKKMYIYDVATDESFEVYTSQMVFEGIGIANKFKTIIDGEWGGVVRENYPFSIDGIYYRIIKEVENGDTAGYRRTDLTYAGDLVLNAGTAVSEALDKVVEQLGEYEYYYDIYGRFIFQRKKIYYNVAWNGAVTNSDEGTYYDPLNNPSEIYNFTFPLLVESYANKPTYTNIRNDFVCWGKTDSEAAIHLRYSIDDKPTSYTSLLTGQSFVAIGEDAINGETVVDWRELLYRMSVDNSRGQEYCRQLTLALNKDQEMYHYDYNKIPSYSDCYYYDTDEGIFKVPEDEDEYNNLKVNHKFLFGYNESYSVDETKLEEIEKWQKTWNTGYDYCYADFLAFWHLIYDMRSIEELQRATDITETQIEDRIERHSEWEANGWWNPDIIAYYAESGSTEKIVHFTDPSSLLFWFDMIEDAELSKYKISIIGRRPEVVNDDSVKALFFRDTPEVLFIDPTEAQPQNSGVSYVKLNLTGSLINYFNISSQGKSAKETLDNTLYEKTYYQESITISCLPIYYLEPNTRIKVVDNKTGISGIFVIKSISIPLEHSNMMSITATRLADRIL